MNNCFDDYNILKILYEGNYESMKAEENFYELIF